MELSAQEMVRYARNIIVPQIGVSGQIKLKRSRVFIAGCGGLGSPASLYLAGAGVGNIVLVDSDAVSASNLQRQIIYKDSMSGSPKADAAAETLRALNPDIKVEQSQNRLRPDNILSALKGSDVVLDCFDNFESRYLLNSACALLGIPCVYGAVYRVEGQASVFNYKTGGCYQCLYPEPVQDLKCCADAGVLGPMAGIIGMIQAVETIKLITGFGGSLAGRVLLFDAAGMEMNSVNLPKRPDCPVCSERAAKKLITAASENGRTALKML